MRSSSWFGGAMHIECSNWLGVVQRRCSNWFRDIYHRGSDWLGAMHISCASCTMFMKECNGLESILMTYYLRLTMDLDITFGFWATLMMLCNLGQFLCPIKWIWKYALKQRNGFGGMLLKQHNGFGGMLWSNTMDLELCLWSNAINLEQFLWKRNGFGCSYEATQWIFETMLMKQTMDLRSNAIDLEVC